MNHWGGKDLNKGDDIMVDQSYSERQLFESMKKFFWISNVKYFDGRHTKTW